MVRKLTKRAVALGVPMALLAGPVLAATFQGPNSSDPPYLVPTQPGISTKSILTVGDSPSNSSYRMVGIPDGLGAYDNHNRTFTVLMNHELGETVGSVRAHGSKGAFVSRFVIRKSDLAVLSGEDLIKQVFLANGDPDPDLTTFRRLCSADLAEASAFFNRSGLFGLRSAGYNAGRIFLNGEETGAEGRAFAHVSGGPDDGKSYELPHMGKFSYENLVANPATGNTTVTVGLDDSTPGQVYVYVGSKKNSGSPVDRAGLTGGKLFGIKAPFVQEDATTSVADNSWFPFGAAALGDVSGLTGAQLETLSGTNVTKFARPEDGAWDPQNPNDFYFVTTAGIDQHSRLWRLRFVDPTDPTKGGKLQMLLEGPKENLATSPGPKMMDNMSVDKRGKVMIQEDPGNQDYVANVYEYDINSDSVRKVLEFDRGRFEPPGDADFLTRDEESSGIIPMFDILGPGTYLLDAQVHRAHPDAELVEYGQLLAMKVHRDRGRPGLVGLPDLELDVEDEGEFRLKSD